MNKQINVFNYASHYCKTSSLNFKISLIWNCTVVPNGNQVQSSVVQNLVFILSDLIT